ncbi:uncharacterized protein LOC62_05G007734 [Vanrija pseudolonga]|uniref:Uncharacterized protein n=1 Tax=Vanrija pseudolonga TaxID=143232 RepID=A0AAF0YCH4_9TREE|nr:hypothetical protein LOC62_05G007734 [Vanrija pseudolonga]
MRIPAPPAGAGIAVPVLTLLAAFVVLIFGFAEAYWTNHASDWDTYRMFESREYKNWSTPVAIFFIGLALIGFGVGWFGLKARQSARVRRVVVCLALASAAVPLTLPLAVINIVRRYVTKEFIVHNCGLQWMATHKVSSSFTLDLEKTCEPLWKRDTNLCITASVFLLLYSVWLTVYGIWAYRRLSTPARPRISAPLSYIDGGPRKSEADTIRSFGSVVSFGTGAPSMWTAGTHTLPSTPQKLHKLGDRTEVLTEAEVDGGSALHVPVDEEEGDDVFLDKPRAHFLMAEGSSPRGSTESQRDSFKTAPGSARTSLQAARELDKRLSARPIQSARQYSVFETDSSADGESRKSMATSVGSPSPKRKTLPALPPSASARSSTKANERAGGVSSVASGRDGRLSSRISDILSGMPPPPPIPAGGFDLGRWGQANRAATRSTTELTAAAAALSPPPPSYAPDRRSARNSRLTTRTTASDRLTNRGSHVPSEAGVTPALSMGHSSSESSDDESDMGMRFEPLPAFTPLRLSFELPE